MTARSAKCRSTVEAGTLWLIPFRGWSNTRPPMVALIAGPGNNKFSVAGSRSYSNSFLLDGTDVNDSSNSTPGGAAGTNLGVDAIKKFKIVATTVSAGYGRGFRAGGSPLPPKGAEHLHRGVCGF